MTNKPLSSDPVTNQANDAANRFVSETQHIELNADEQDADAIIRNIRFMAHSAGFEHGYRALRHKLVEVIEERDGNNDSELLSNIIAALHN